MDIDLASPLFLLLLMVCFKICVARDKVRAKSPLYSRPEGLGVGKDAISIIMTKEWRGFVWIFDRPIYGLF